MKRVIILLAALVLSACAPAAAPAPEATATVHINPTLYPTDPPATATLEEIVLPTLTRKPTATRKPTDTALPTIVIKPASTATKAKVVNTQPPAATPAPAVIADTPTAAPVIQETPTAAPVVEQPTAAPPPSGGGYVCDGGAACIKGNISSNGHLYHFPGCPSYNATKIDEGAGERYFTSSAEAEAAGWTKAGNCP